jgi:tRNA(Arg) A34 adenosine deaminase TadA
MNKNTLMENACDLATYSVQIGGGPFGAVIVNEESNIVGKGHNMVTINNDPTAHAEIVAIRDACKNLNNYSLENCTIYTSCEPCPMCLSAIYWSRIKHIYYGNNRVDAQNIGFDDNFIYEEIPKNIEDRKIKLEECNREYAQKSFALWSEKVDKTEY